MSIVSRLLATVIVLVVAVALTACSGSNSGSESPGATVVARVGSSTITLAEVDHETAAQEKENAVGPEGRHGGLTRHQLQERALTSLISYNWVAGEASELGLSPTNQEVEHEYDQQKTELFHTPTAFQEYLTNRGFTPADLILGLKLSTDTERIREMIIRGIPKLTHAEIVAYYNHNEQHYRIPEHRDIRAIRTWTKATITKAIQEIQAGGNFAAIADRVSIDRPYNKMGGAMTGIIPGQEEPGLDQAIFAAKPHTLIGPLHLRDRYYIFEVTKTTPGYQQPLTQVETTIKKELPAQQQTQALTTFIKSWRTKWKNKTSCTPQYTVRKCQQHKPPTPNTEPPEEPTNLN